MSAKLDVKQAYKQTEIGLIPKDWEVAELSKLGLIVTGTTPSTKVEKYWGAGYPFITPTDFSENKYVEETERTVTESGAKQARIIPKDSIMVVCIASVGEVAMASSASITNQQINSVITKKGINPQFVYYSMLFNKIRLKRWAGITTSPIIKKSLFERFSIAIPLDEKEQKKIAEMLTGVDETIGKANESIEKTQRLKKGLMNDLLTGRKRVGSRWHVVGGGYTQTEIGEIPKDWEVVKLIDLISELKNGFASGKRDENGIVQIRMNNIATDGRLLLDSYLKVPKPELINGFLLKRNDFLFNNTNSIDLVGKSAIFKRAAFPCTFSNHFTRLRFDESKVIPEWVLNHFIVLWRKGFFKSVAIRHVGQSAVNKDQLLKIKIPLPPLQEQKKIAEILTIVDDRIELLRKRKENHQRIKKGLMNDLLTGRKRVGSR